VAERLGFLDQVARDELKCITGIGPVFWRMLNRLGYPSCRRLAALDQAELEKLAPTASASRPSASAAKASAKRLLRKRPARDPRPLAWVVPHAPS
jgi:hypothetical protein